MKFTKQLLITKLKATGVHFSLSFVVFIYLVYQIYYNWFPEPFFSTDGGWQGIRLVAAVDLVLGPFITFLIFDLRKSRKEIVFDLSIIAVIQFSALAYGVVQTYNQRPIAVVLIDDYVFSGVMEQYGGKLKSEQELSQYSDEKPPIIYADLPGDLEELAEVQRIKDEENVMVHAQMQLYRPHEEFVRQLRSRQALYTGQLDLFNDRKDYETWLQENDKSADEIMIALLSGRYKTAWLVFDLEGKYLSYFK